MVSKKVRETAGKIKRLEIQGASRVRKAVIKALQQSILESQASSLSAFRKELKANMFVLLMTRPTEPGMRAAIRVLLFESRRKLPLENLKQALVERCKLFEIERKKSMEKIAEYGARKIPKKGVVFTHCHSHSVEEILVKAWKKKLLKEVYCTETRPRYQGRITASNLLKAGLPVTMVVDGAAASFMKEADAFFSGADAILADGTLVNKIGTFNVSLAAERFGVPHYVASSTHKFEPLSVFGHKEEIEERSWKEVWEKKPSRLCIRNPAFDLTPSELVKNIITERGVFGSEAFGAFMYEKMELDEKSEREISLQYLLKRKK